ncbi:MAG: hypothetical protein GY801_39745, partial [bacterium]|nr:hypothetical protein [bacterium]
MIHLRKVQQQWSRGKSSWLFYSLLAIVTISIIWSCGKLSDDTSRPSTPTGISGGIPVTGGPKATAGTYSLTLTADRNSIPADATNFSVLSAALSDSSGRSVFGYTVAFSTSGNIGWFYDPTAGLLVSEDQSITEEDGVATTRLYGTQSGEVSVIAAIDLNSDGVVDLMASKVIVLTPAGPATCAGTYCLEIGANPDTVPADMATYAIVYATIHDSSGGTVDGLTVTFESELGYVHNDPTPPSSPSTTATAVTNKNGSVSIYYYGDRAGSAVITASVSPSDLIGTLINTTIIHVTEGPGEPGDNVPGLFIDVNPSFQSLEGDSSTGLADAETVTITVDVWDSSGDEVGPGVRVEFSGNVVGYAETESDGRATLEVEPGSLYIGTHIFEFTACTYGINPDQTQLCSTGSFGVQVLPPEMEIAISALP